MADKYVINGHKYGWASIEVGIPGYANPEFTAISYNPKVDFGRQRASGIYVIGDTQGEADVEGSITLTKGSFEMWKRTAGPGFLMKRFSWTVSYSEGGEESGVITDTLIGVRCSEVNHDHKQGTDGLVVTMPFHVMRILLNGVNPFFVDNSGTGQNVAQQISNVIGL